MNGVSHVYCTVHLVIVYYCSAIALARNLEILHRGRQLVIVVIAF